jgi:P-type Mg2+ transporter
MDELMLPGLIHWESRVGSADRDKRPIGQAISAGLEGPWWSLEPAELCRHLGTTSLGLSFDEAARRLLRFGPNELRPQRAFGRLQVLLNQVRSPLLLLLVFAAAASLMTRDWFDAVLVLVIVAVTVSIGFVREYQAQAAAEALNARVAAQATVLRDGHPVRVPVREVVTGDVVVLSAGSMVPADGVLLEATDLYVSQAVLTGESFPVAKTVATSAPDASLVDRINCVFLGTDVRTGSGRYVAVKTAGRTQFGTIAHRLQLRPPETEFDRGLRHFGYTLARMMLLMIVVVLVGNILLGRPVIQTLLFSVALAVGLSPELLPAILSVNLARGAEMMARRGVLVRRLNAIENLGSMDTLCTDKTGTLTEGVVRLEGGYDVCGCPSSEVLELAARNAALQSGVANPLDEAILQAHAPDLNAVEKLAEVPYDFVRRRMSVVINDTGGGGGRGEVRLIMKGAFEEVLRECARLPDYSTLDPIHREALAARADAWNTQGVRLLAVAERRLEKKPVYGREDEHDLQFRGFITFLDRPKEGIAQAIADLRGLGVAVKLITGDAKAVAQHVARAVGMDGDRVLTGRELHALPDPALWRAAETTELFVEADPNQKERIILALKKTGHVVGFLGDGVNDAPAMHAADTSISVERAVDVARQAADFVLLDRHLDVIRRGVEEGRKTFANTLKYVLTTMSANLGNMISMAAVSLYLPFLPLLAPQVLLNNFLSDVPAVGLADDHVDPEMVDRPRRWDVRFIRRFMVEFGLLSSVFDMLTFACLLGAFAVGEALFRTGWFVESLLTELAVALVVRTRRPFFRSRPASVLLWSTVGVAAAAVAIPYLPFSDRLGFTPLPTGLLAALVGITALYVLATEFLKRRFYRERVSR